MPHVIQASLADLFSFLLKGVITTIKVLLDCVALLLGYSQTRSKAHVSVLRNYQHMRLER